MGQKPKKNKIERILDGVGIWTAWFRLLPHRLATQYFGMTWLTTTQKIIMNIVIRFPYAMIIASRGWGKSQILAACICVVATLYPGKEITIAAGVRRQSTNVLLKIIEQFMPNSPNLQNEIAEFKVAGNEAYIKWRNGSIVRVVTARDSSRSARTHWLIVDEFVQVKKSVLDSVLRRFKAGQRRPGFYDNPAYKDVPKEENKETYISSASFKHHYAWDKFKSYVKGMMTGTRHFVVGFPYQMAVRDGYYPLQQVIDDMSESDFDSLKWSMEMDSLFWGEAEDAFFAFDDFDANRTLPVPVYPPGFYSIIGDSKFKPRPKARDEIRICANDIATQGGSKNDNSCFAIMSLTPKGRFYQRTLIYMETMNGGHTHDQAVKIRQLCDDFDCDYVVVDAAGVGIGVYDALVRDLTDEERGVVYPAWSCINDAGMAARCNDIEAPKKIYAIKASLQFNSDCAVLLRDVLRSGRLRLLVNESEGNEFWSNNEAFLRLSPENQILFQAPYYQTSSLVNEAVNLSYTVQSGHVRVSEPSGARKDRYSAVAYANWVSTQIEREREPGKDRTGREVHFEIRKPQMYSRAGRW